MSASFSSSRFVVRHHSKTFELLCSGLKDEESAQQLSVALLTVRSHIATILHKLNLTRKHINMLTIDGKNPASMFVIEKNGGKLEWHRTLEDGEMHSCYWIDLL